MDDNKTLSLLGLLAFLAFIAFSTFMVWHTCQQTKSIVTTEELKRASEIVRRLESGR